MLEAILTAEQRQLRDEVRAFVKGVPRQLILDMDADRVRYPREYVQELAQHHLLGLRFPTEYGGRGLGWTDEIVALEEVGVLGTSLACLYSLPSIVGEALNVFGTPEQKARWLRPVLAGELMVAEALTEPRGGSDFFWHDDHRPSPRGHLCPGGAKAVRGGCRGGRSVSGLRTDRPGGQTP